MKRGLPRAVKAALVLASAASCLPPPYRPPSAEEPHAVVKIRRVYESPAGVTLEETCLVGGNTALVKRDPVELASSPRTDAFLVHPVPARLEMSAAFVHSETRLVDETYTEQEPYMATETYPCGFGTSPQTCTRMVTHYRTVTKHRMVMKPVEVTDGACKSAMTLAPAAGAAYLLDFTYRDNGVCSMSCVQQVATPPAAGTTDATFQGQACPAPTEPQSKPVDEP